MSNRGKQFKALSPKKVSRRKRTPRCDSCGKRDGEDAGGEGQPKIRLKLCARCRAVAYCGMECQKAGWKVHREVCVHYASAAELPPQSPLVNHQKVSGTGQRGSRRKVIYGGAVGTVGATPRQREHAPTRHPFFGRQNSIESDRRVTVGNPQSSKALREGQRQQQQQSEARRRSPQTTQPAIEEEPCPSPPMMQRLSYPGGGRSRQGSKSGSSGGNDTKRPSPVGKSPSEKPQPRQSPGAAVAAAVKMAASRARRRTHNLTKGGRAYGSLSPTPAPPAAEEVKRRRAGSGPVRRESAPLYPAALEKTKRLAARKDASLAADASRRGPPPPYSSVAHRAESARKPPPSTSPNDGKAAAAPPRRSSSTADVRQTTRIPPPLPPRPSVSLDANTAFPRGSSLSPGLAGGTSTGTPQQLAPENKAGGGQPAGEHESTEGKGVEAPRESQLKNEKLQVSRSGGGGEAEIDALEVPKDGEGGGMQAAREGEEEEEEDTEEPTPEPRAGDDAQARGAHEAPEWVVPPPVAKDRSQDSAAGSPRAREDDNEVVRVQPALTKGSAHKVSQDLAAGSVLGGEGDPALAKDSAAGSSRDSAAGSPRTGEAISVVPVQPALTKGSEHDLSKDTAADSVSDRDGDAGLGKDSAAGWSRDSAAGSPRPRGEDSSVVPVQPALTKGSEHEVSQDSSAGSVLGRESGTAAAGSSRDSAAGSPQPREDNLVPARPAMAKGSAGTASQDSAAGSMSGQESDAAVLPVRPSLAPCSVDSLSQDSAAGSTTAHENHQAPAVPLPMEPPPPIQTSSKTGASGLADTGVFDSCPPSTGASPSEPVSQRSLSVGTVPQFLSMPLVLAAREKASAAVAAWQKDRRNSPRPRPPVSPGPAALSQSSPLKSAFRFRKPSAALEHDYEGPERTPSSAATLGGGAGRKLSAPLLSRTFSALSSAASHASPGSASRTTRPPFVPTIELSPRASLPTSPHAPGPRITDTAKFYRERAGDVGLLPPASKAYFGRPSGFSVHVLVASALSAADLGDRQQQHLEGGDSNRPRLYYAFEDRGRVAEALRPGDVVLVTPGRYEARAWGLQRLMSSVEIIGAGDAADCVLYNDPARSGPAGEHYLVGVMGGALGSAAGGGARVPEVKGKDVVADDDDSDSGFEDGALGPANSLVHSFSGRAVRVRLANLTLEQGSGYRGAVYQLGRESHLEMDGCTVVGSKGGVNVDQGTCIIRDSWISGSEVFGVHIGGEGAVEHCSIRGCGGGGRGGGEGGKYLSSSTVGNTEDEDDDDGTDVNRVGSMPAISILQSSRVRVRFNVIRDNAGHTLQYRDAPLPGGDGKYALLARRAEAEAEEKLRSWLGSAAVLLREHLQGQHREGSVVSEGNQCHLNRGCDLARCSGGGAVEEMGTAAGGDSGGGSVASGAAAESTTGEGEGLEPEAGGQEMGEEVSRDGPSRGGARTGTLRGQHTCVPTAEEEGLPLPAAMTLRFLAAMDEGYVGSRREENARLKKRKKEAGAG